MTEHDTILDNPVWMALTGRQRHLGRVAERAARYHGDVSPLAALREPTPEAVDELAGLTAPGEMVGVLDAAAAAGRSSAFEVVGVLRLRQMVCAEAPPAPTRRFDTLGLDDVEEMLKLVEMTQPGPFERRTIEMGVYLGLRERGRLLAMAGERMAAGPCTEVSAVCTHPDARRRGLGEQLVQAVAAGISARGETPFLHVAPESATFRTSLALYERLGFCARRDAEIAFLRRV